MQFLYVLYWWLILLFIGLIVFPLVSRVCGSLDDRGYSISKVIGLIFMTFISWMLSSLNVVSFGYVNITISILLLIAVSLFFGRRNLKISQWPWGKILTSELVFTLAFAAFILIKFYKPDIYYQGAPDAVSNYAFIQSILRGGYMPAVDPYFSGGSIPYYYGGHYVVATLTRFSGVPASISYNIAVAMFYSLAVYVSYGLGYNLTKRRAYGLIAILLICIVGCISGAFQLAAHVSNHTVLGYAPGNPGNIIDWMLSFDFKAAERLIDGALVHYPYYAFLLGDMHSYFMSIPFQLAYIALILALYLKSRTGIPFNRSDMLLTVFVLSVSLGFFFILNTWDYPTYIIFTISAFVLLRIWSRVRWNFIIPVAIAVLSFILYLPYYLAGRMSGFAGIGLLHSDLRTSVAELLEFCAPFLLIIGTFLLILLKQEALYSKKAVIVAISIFIAVVMVSIFCHFQLLLLVVPIGLISLSAVFAPKMQPEKKFLLLLIIMAMALAFFCDFAYIDDVFTGVWERFNTIIKLYSQLWIFLSLAAVYAVYAILNYWIKVCGKEKVLKVSWIGLLSVVLVAALIHPVVSTVSTTSGRDTSWQLNRGTLDGMAYIEAVNQGDYEAINWLNRNIDGTPVILEAPGDPNGYSSIISSFTGLPTVIGWQTYEIVWRQDWDAVYNRSIEADMIYNTLDNDEAEELLQKYSVEYIYIGTLERNRYSHWGLQKFETFNDDYSVVYQNNDVVIYRFKEA